MIYKTRCFKDWVAIIYFSLIDTLSSMSDKLKYCHFLQERTCSDIISSSV